jgi:hypothetical protein
MAQAPDGLPRGLPRLGQRVALLTLGHPPLDQLQAHEQRAEGLDRVVVDVAGDALALLLLGPDQLGQQPLALPG